MRTTGQCVHSRMPPEFVLPDFVMLYLNKGGKYIMDTHRCCLAEVMRGTNQMERKMHIAKYFESKPMNLQRPSRRCYVGSGSSWRPPQDEAIARYSRLLRRSITDAFTAKPIRRNYSWLDCKARQWLKQHLDDIVVVDCDKGLGDVIIPRAWVNNELQRLLADGFQKLQPEAFKARSFEARCTLELLARQAESTGTLCARQTHFMLQHVFSAAEGSFRLRVKLHKQPIAGRPIANLSHSWVTPACMFLCDVLMPMQEGLKRVVSSSYEFSREDATDSSLRF